MASGGLCAVLEAPAIVAGLDDVAVVCQPIEHGGCHFGVADSAKKEIATQTDLLEPPRRQSSLESERASRAREGS